MTPTAWEAAGLDKTYWEKHSLDIRIRLAAAPYLNGWGYDIAHPRVLWGLPDGMLGASGIVGGATVTNCSTLTASILTSVFPTAPWTLAEYGDLQVFADRLPATDSPIQAVERMGIGTRRTSFRQGRWHLVQGVRRAPEDADGFSGHAFLVLADRDTTFQVLEATSRRGQDRQRIGPRYRRASFGDLNREYPVDLHIAALHGA